ncbi:MAG: hypothetical protein E6470_17170 [Enterobacteriaceae bacterium]|nr:hypothetical protein [Enterobacteriaceae bacterium]
MTVTNEQIQALKAAANKLHRSDLFVSFPDEERQVADINYCNSTLARVFPDRWPTTPPDVKAKQVENWANYFVLVNPKFILSLLEERDADKALIAEQAKRIAELEASLKNLRESMAAIHNTIRLDGAGVSLSVLLSASKRAYEESAAAAGITLVVGE